MLNWLWGLMIIIGVSYGIVTGNAEAVSNASIDGAKDAVTMSITMLGIMAMWTGCDGDRKRVRADGSYDKRTVSGIAFLVPGNSKRT